jgi:hypothetical protein
MVRSAPVVAITRCRTGVVVASSANVGASACAVSMSLKLMPVAVGCGGHEERHLAGIGRWARAG